MGSKDRTGTLHSIDTAGQTAFKSDLSLNLFTVGTIYPRTRISKRAENFFHQTNQWKQQEHTMVEALMTLICYSKIKKKNPCGTSK